MGSTKSSAHLLSSLLALILFFSTDVFRQSGMMMVEGLKFDLTAHPPGQHKQAERCIRNFVTKDTLVVVTATVGGTKGDGQTVNMHVCISFFLLLLLWYTRIYLSFSFHLVINPLCWVHIPASLIWDTFRWMLYVIPHTIRCLIHGFD